MAEAPDQLSIIAEILVSDLGDSPFAILQNDRYVVLISDKLGVATVAGDRDSSMAQKGALEIARQAGLLGIKVQVHPFVVSDKADGGDDMHVRPAAIALDIRSALAARAKGVDAMPLEDATRLVDFLNGKVRREVRKPAKKLEPPTPELKRLLAATVQRALGECKPWVAGVQISVDHVVAENFMLAPMLLAAAENWTAPYLAAKRQGGFCFSIAKDEETMLGFRTRGVWAASELILLLNVSAVIRRQCRKDICDLDPVLLRFANFVLEIKGKEGATDIFGDVDSMLVSEQ